MKNLSSTVRHCIEFSLASSDLLRQLGSRCTKFGNSPRITVLKCGAISIVSAITVIHWGIQCDTQKRTADSSPKCKHCGTHSMQIQKTNCDYMILQILRTYQY